MKIITLSLLLSCVASGQISASAAPVASASVYDEEDSIKKMLEKFNVDNQVRRVQRKEDTLLKTYIIAAKNPHDKKIQEDLSMEQKEYKGTLGEISMNSPMDGSGLTTTVNNTIRLLLKNELLTRQVQRLENKAK